LLTTLSDLSSQVTVVFPVHPRTRQRLHHLRSGNTAHFHLHLLGPLPYLEFIALERRAAFVITDSGGIQEETTFLGIPCLTVRENTERPITVTFGTNQLVGRDLEKLIAAAKRTLKVVWPDRRPKQPDMARVPLWDGHAAERIAQIVVQSTR
jgi:UDP-N-acetylglucosamine 2-epimerase (non-hydrolysing)